MNQYQRYFAWKHLKNGSNILVDYKDYILCENCKFSVDDGRELAELMKILSEIESEDLSVKILLYHGVGRNKYFYADMICIMGKINDISERFSRFSTPSEIITSPDEIYLEDLNVCIIEKRKQHIINLSEHDFTYLYWD